MPRLSFRRIARFFLLAVLTFGVLVACNNQSSPPTGSVSSPSSPLVVASSPWLGFSGHYIALEKNFFQEEGITVEDQYFQVATDANNAALADRVDLLWTGVPDLVVMAERDPSLRLIALADYSNGADGILARNISSPEALKGKAIAWEGLPLQALLLQNYLEQGGLTPNDIELMTITAAEAATAFASKQVDVAVTYEPWLSKAAQEGQGQIIFSSKNTNIIPDGLVAQADTIESRRADIVAYLKAVDKGVQFMRENPTEAAQIVAEKLGVTPEEVPGLWETVRMFDMEENTTVVFNPDDPMNVIDSLTFATKTTYEVGLTQSKVDGTTLYDDSLVKAAVN